MINLITFTVGPTVGGAGVSTATGYSRNVKGKVLAVHVDHSVGGAGTTDFTLSDAEDPIAESIFTLTDSVTDTKRYPRRPTQNSAGTDATYDGTRKVHEPYVVCGRLKGVLAQGNDGQTATVYVWLER